VKEKVGLSAWTVLFSKEMKQDCIQISLVVYVEREMEQQLLPGEVTFKLAVNPKCE